MKSMRNVCLAVTVLTLVGAFGLETAAQAPAPTWRAISATGIRIEWPAVPGARYDLIVPSHNFVTPFPIDTAYVQVDPLPPGTYVVQVRVAGTNIVSSPVTIDWTGGAGGSGGCLPLSAPTIGSTVSGNVVTVTWGAVPGAIGYRLQVGTSPGATQFSQDFNASTFTFTAPVPVLGTFYARVIAANSCGQVMSSTPDHQFTIGSSTPVGPQNPAPGGGLPFAIPAVCSTGDRLGCINAMAALSAEWGQCRAGVGVGCNRFTRQVVYAFSRTDPNWKMIRAARGGHACSCSSCGPSDGTMFREDTTVYAGDGRVFDMIQGAGAPGASLKFDFVGTVRPGDTPDDAPVCR